MKDFNATNSEEEGSEVEDKIAIYRDSDYSKLTGMENDLGDALRIRGDLAAAEKAHRAGAY